MPDNRLLLEIKDLSVKFPVPGGEICAVNGIDLAIPRGENHWDCRGVGMRQECVCLFHSEAEP